MFEAQIVLRKQRRIIILNPGAILVLVAVAALATALFIHLLY